MKRECKDVGSLGAWLWTRACQLVLSVLLISMTYARDAWDVRDILLLTLLASGHIFLHPLAYGRADDTALTFRQYWRSERAVWSDVAAIDWNRWRSGELRVYLIGRQGRVRRLTFIMNPPIHQLKSIFLRGEIPEIVVWMRNRLRA